MRLRDLRLCGLALVTMAVFGGVHLIAVDVPWLRRLELAALDAQIRFRGPQKPGPETVIVMIDDRTIAELGHWPLPRQKLAELVTRPASGGSHSHRHRHPVRRPRTFGCQRARDRRKPGRRRARAGGSRGGQRHSAVHFRVWPAPGSDRETIAHERRVCEVAQGRRLSSGSTRADGGRGPTSGADRARDARPHAGGLRRRRRTALRVSGARLRCRLLPFDGSARCPVLPGRPVERGRPRTGQRHFARPSLCSYRPADAVPRQLSRATGHVPHLFAFAGAAGRCARVGVTRSDRPGGRTLRWARATRSSRPSLR